MKKQALLVAFLYALLHTAIAGTFFVDSAAAQETPIDIVKVKIEAPVDGATYTSEDVRLKVEIYIWDASDTIDILLNRVEITYLLDGEIYPVFSSVDTTMKGLSNGEHWLSVSVQATYSGFVPKNSYFDSSGVTFTVNTGVAPDVSVLGMQEYETSDVWFNVTVEEPVSWLGYSLDGAGNVTVSGSEPAWVFGRYHYRVVLDGLADGSHSLVVYAMDAVGNTGVKEKAFVVNAGSTPEPDDDGSEPEPNGTLPLITVVIAATIIGVVVAIASLAVALLYLKKKRSSADR